jgi:dynamin-binding protein
MEPIEQIIRAYNPPGLAIKKHSKLHLDYEKYRLGMSSGKTKINRKLLKLVNQYESLNKNLEMELPKLYTGSRKIGNICLIQFIAIQREWYSIWQDKVRTVLDESQLPKDISDIIETFNRDFKHVEARVQELGIIGGTLLGDTTKGKALSQSTIEDSDALNKSKSQFSNISNHDRGLSTAGNKSPSLPTLGFEKRLSGQFTFTPIITSTLGISTDNSKPDRKSSDMSNSASHNVESLPSPARRPFSGIFHSAMPLLDSPEESPQSSRASSNGHNVSGGYNVLYLAASLYEFGFEFNLSDSALKSEAGYPYLTYPAGEVCQVSQPQCRLSELTFR